MKNVVDNLAMFLVVILSLGIVYLVVQYIAIDSEADNKTVYSIPKEKEESKQAKTANYLDSLEGYGEDVDVKVDEKKENLSNVVAVKSELASDELGQVVTDKSKASYMENLQNYTGDEAQAKGSEKEDVNEPVDLKKLPQEEREDELGNAIDAALDDL